MSHAPQNEQYAVVSDQVEAMALANQPVPWPVAEQLRIGANAMELVALSGLQTVVQTVSSPEAHAHEPYRIFTNPYERMEYMHLTDNLIATLDGSDEDNVVGPYDTVIYLDSSARPVNWMVRGLWDFAAQKDADGNPLPCPETLFSNMDARRDNANSSEHDTAELIRTYPTLAQKDPAKPKRILVVDEIAVSGDTIDVATRRFQAAFPDHQFDGYVWKDERNTSDLNNVRWYERDSDRYRLVVDANALTDQQRAQLAAQRSDSNPHQSKWLAAPNPNADGPRILRSEINQMVADVQRGDMPYWPSIKRAAGDTEARIQASNSGLSPREFATFRAWMKRHYAPSSVAGMLVTDAMGPLSDQEARAYLRKKTELRQPVPKLDSKTAAFADAFGYR